MCACGVLRFLGLCEVVGKASRFNSYSKKFCDSLKNRATLLFLRGSTSRESLLLLPFATEKGIVFSPAFGRQKTWWEKQRDTQPS